MTRVPSLRRLSPLILLVVALVAIATLPLLNPPGAHGQGRNEPARMYGISLTKMPAPGIGCPHEDWYPRLGSSSNSPCTLGLRPAYGVGDVIQLGVSFYPEVEVTGTPQLNLTIGDSTRAADYKGVKELEPGWQVVIFEYQVAPGDYDIDNIEVAGTNALVLNGGAITTKDNGLDAELTLREDRLRKWAVEIDTIPPKLLGVSIVPSSSPIVQWTGNYRAGDEYIIRLEFDEPIYFSGLPATNQAALTHPSVSVLFGENERRTSLYHHAPCCNSNVINFKYTVKKGDVAANGASIPANAIHLNGGVIRDDAGNQPSLNHPAVEGDNRPVDGNRSIVPVVESLAITSEPRWNDDTYLYGEKIEVTATFTRNVMPVLGIHSPISGVSEQRIELDIGGQARTARISGNDGRKVRFNYTVQQDDVDDNGIAVKANSLSWRGTIYEVEGESNEPYWDYIEPDWDRLLFFSRGITDAYGDVNAVISHDAISDDDGHMVDGIPNARATGVPTIMGTAQVGQTLTADTSGISDADGLDKVSYAYEWALRVGNTRFVRGKGTTYTLTTDDLGHTVDVKVTFTDDDGNSEFLYSDVTAAVEAADANAAPTVSGAIGDAIIVNESGTQTVSLSGVFDDADGDALTITANSSDENVATVSVSADQSTLTVSAQARGTAIIGVKAADGNGGAVWELFTVTVKAAPTVASAIAEISGLEAEDSRTISMSRVFSDPDGDAVTVTQASSSDTSIAAVSAAIDGATAAITAVTVTAGSEGTATITVTARDADGNTVSDAFDVTVNAPAAQQQKVNNPPTVSGAIADVTIVSESGTRQVSLSGVFDDADGDALTVTASSSDENTATVSVSADHSTLTVTAQARGTATITVTAADGYGGSVEDSFTVRVKAAPVVASAISDVSGLEEGATRDVSLAGVFSDADGDSLTVTATSSDEGKATVSVAADGSALTVSGVSEGTATITVTAQDADGNTVSDAFQVEVVQVPEPEPDPVELPGPVGNLQLTATHDSVSVSWSAPAPDSGGEVRGYIVHLKPEDGGKGRTKTPRAKKTKVTFDNLEAGRTYRVWVRAQNEAGKGERVHATITLPEAEPAQQDQGDQGEQGEQGDGQQQDGQSGQ